VHFFQYNSLISTYDINGKEIDNPFRIKTYKILVKSDKIINNNNLSEHLIKQYGYLEYFKNQDYYSTKEIKENFLALCKKDKQIRLKFGVMFGAAKFLKFLDFHKY